MRTLVVLFYTLHRVVLLFVRSPLQFLTYLLGFFSSFRIRAPAPIPVSLFIISTQIKFRRRTLFPIL